MKKIFTRKTVFLSVILAAFSLTANAQVNFKEGVANMAQAGTTRDTISYGDVGGTTRYQFDYTWHFNTNKPATLLQNPDNAANLGTLQKASTRKGWYSVGVRENGAVAGLAGGNLGKTNTNNYAGGDPVYFANVATLRDYLGSTTLNYPDTGTPLNAVDSAASCVFGMPNGGAAWATYPGKYKKTNTRVYFNLGGSILTSDMSFTLMTYDAGTSGKPVTVKLIVSLAPPAHSAPGISATSVIGIGADKTDSIALGNNGPIRYEKTIFTSSSNVMADSVRINICETFGIPISEMNFKKVIVSLITEASDLTPEEGKYDPIIALDNFHFNFWLDSPSIPEVQTIVKQPSAVKVSTVSSTNIIGKTGQIEITGASNTVAVYGITGQKVASVNSAQGTQSISVPAGIYIVKENNQPTVKVVVK